MPRIYPQQEEEERIRQLKADIAEVFSESSKSFCLTSLIVKLKTKGKWCPREDVQEVLKSLESEKRIVQDSQLLFCDRIYYRLVKH